MSKKSTLRLRATHGSDKTPLQIGAIKIPCYVLSDGTRVFSQNGMQKAIGYRGTSGDWLKKFIGLKDFQQSYNSATLDSLGDVIEFDRLGAGGSASTTYGYEATKLIDLCDWILELKKHNLLKENQLTYAEHAESIIRAVAKVGIIALVDEATGYQNEVKRAKNELQQFLNKFIEQEKAARWVKTFPDEFFEMIFQMNGWTWNDFTKNRKPSAIGHFINNYIYARIGPMILSELRRKNPINQQTGSRSKKHHQWLTPDYGHPKLKEHFASIFTIWKLSGGNKREFEKLLDKALPKFGQTFLIDFPSEN